MSKTSKAKFTEQTGHDFSELKKVKFKEEIPMGGCSYYYLLSTDKIYAFHSYDSDWHDGEDVRSIAWCNGKSFAK